MEFKVFFTCPGDSNCFGIMKSGMPVGLDLLNQLRAEVGEQIPHEQVASTIGDRHVAPLLVLTEEQAAFTGLFRSNNECIVKVPPMYLNSCTKLVPLGKTAYSIDVDMPKLYEFWKGVSFSTDLVQLEKVRIVLDSLRPFWRNPELRPVTEEGATYHFLEDKGCSPSFLALPDALRESVGTSYSDINICTILKI